MHFVFPTCAGPVVTIEDPRIALHTDKQVVATWREVIFEVWLARGVERDIRACTEAVGKILSHTEGRIVGFTAVHPQAIGPVDGATRAALADHTKQHNERSRAGALVLLAGGFSGAMIRSIATGLNILSPPKHPTKVFDSIERACPWVVAHVAPVDGRAVTADELRAVFEKLPRPPGA